MNKGPQNKEATSSFIFLFQRKTFLLFELPSWLDSDGEGYYLSQNLTEVPADISSFYANGEIDDLKLFYYLKEVMGWEFIYEDRRTERVFLTKLEAEDYGNARSYNYPHGWAVCCVPAAGDLDGILAKA